MQKNRDFFYSTSQSVSFLEKKKFQWIDTNLWNKVLSKHPCSLNFAASKGFTNSFAYCIASATCSPRPKNCSSCWCLAQDHQLLLWRPCLPERRVSVPPWQQLAAEAPCPQPSSSPICTPLLPKLWVIFHSAAKHPHSPTKIFPPWDKPTAHFIFSIHLYKTCSQ